MTSLLAVTSLQNRARSELFFMNFIKGAVSDFKTSHGYLRSMKKIIEFV